MAGSKTNYLEYAILNHVLRGTTYTSPGTVYAGLFLTTAPDDTTVSPYTNEVSGNNYGRVSVTFDAPTGADGNPSQVVNQVVSFPAATGNWGDIVGWGIFDASTSGNLLYWGDVSPAVTINDGDTAKFSAGAIVVKEG